MPKATRPACPVAGCSNTRSATHMMCRSHWSLVPRKLQADVYRLRDEYLGAGGDAQLPAYQAYLAIRKKALDTVGGERTDG